jgi:hypothetical protein
MIIDGSYVEERKEKTPQAVIKENDNKQHTYFCRATQLPTQEKDSKCR